MTTQEESFQHEKTIRFSCHNTKLIKYDVSLPSVASVLASEFRMSRLETVVYDGYSDVLTTDSLRPSVFHLKLTEVPLGRIHGIVGCHRALKASFGYLSTPPKKKKKNMGVKF